MSHAYLATNLSVNTPKLLCNLWESVNMYSRCPQLPWKQSPWDRLINNLHLANHEWRKGLIFAHHSLNIHLISN